MIQYLHNGESNMGKLIIDGNSVFEIDEECIKRRKQVPKSCDVEKYLMKSDKFVTSNIEKKSRKEG